VILPRKCCLYLKLACFDVFCGPKFNVLVTTKAVKLHVECLGKGAVVTNRSKRLSSLFLLSPVNINQTKPVTPVEVDTIGK